MGQGGSVILKVNFEDVEVYYRASKIHLDMIYKIHNYKYQFSADNCYRYSLNVISEKPAVLSLTSPEAKFVRSIRDLGYSDRAADDVEATTSDVNYRLNFQRLEYPSYHYDARVVIC